MQSVPIITDVVISNPYQGVVYSIQHLYVIKFVSVQSWTIFVCGLSSGKLFKMNFYYILEYIYWKGSENGRVVTNETLATLDTRHRIKTKNTNKKHNTDN